MRPDALRAALAGVDGPTDRLRPGRQREHRRLRSAARDRRRRSRATARWLHVDGAFGLWAAPSPVLRASHVPVLELADSWTTDAHNGSTCRTTRASCSSATPRRIAPRCRSAGILVETWRAAATRTTGCRSRHVARAGSRSSRRCTPWAARARRADRALLPAYATDGRPARRGAGRRDPQRCRAEPDPRPIHAVVENHGAAGSDVAGGDAFTRDVIRRVQEDGTCWLGGRTWHGLGTMRISITSWNTTEADIDRSAEAILRCAEAARAAWGSDRGR